MTSDFHIFKLYGKHINNFEPCGVLSCIICTNIVFNALDNINLPKLKDEARSAGHKNGHPTPRRCLGKSKVFTGCIDFWRSVQHLHHHDWSWNHVYSSCYQGLRHSSWVPSHFICSIFHRGHGGIPIEVHKIWQIHHICWYCG